MNEAQGGFHGQALTLRLFLATLDARQTAARQLEHLLAEGWDRLPLPGSGRTLQRWQMLSVVAAHNLSLAKLYEGHTDALAILSELHAVNPSSVGQVPAASPSVLAAAGSDLTPTWGMWAAEAPGCRVSLHVNSGAACGTVRLHGCKAWCSGARSGSHGLLTAWWPGEQAGPQLVSVALDQPGVEVTDGQWQAVGMDASAGVQVAFDGAIGQLVGEAGAYLSRPGFWHGGAGIAACWYGGAMGIAGELHRALCDSPTGQRDRFRLAAAGRVDVTLQGTAALLREAASWIDSHPTDDARPIALRVRLAAAACAESVLHDVGDALGAAPYCRNRHFAEAAADLPVFIRQSHGQADYAALGESQLAADVPAKGMPWGL